MADKSAIDKALQVISTKRKEEKKSAPTDLVTATWLASTFRMDRTAVQRRLVNCPYVPSPDNRAQKLYDIATAARHLVTPALSPDDFIRVASKGDLPPTLQAQFWDAMLKRQKFEELAARLWPTERVRDVLADTFQTIKFDMQLWVDTLERNMTLTPKQREEIVKLVDGLQGKIYESLVHNAAQKKTGPQLADLPAQIGEVEVVTEEEDDGFDLI